jgi:acyl-CoA thioester hydrolase
MSISAYQHKVQYYETDGMQIVHHSNYIRFFEEARLDFLEKIGVSYAEIERLGYVVPVLSVNADYKSMTHYGETLVICVKFEEFSGLRFAFTYRVYDSESKTLRATGKTTHCYLKDGKPVHLKRELPDLYQSMMEQVGWESEL